MLTAKQNIFETLTLLSSNAVCMSKITLTVKAPSSDWKQQMVPDQSFGHCEDAISGVGEKCSMD